MLCGSYIFKRRLNYELDTVFRIKLTVAFL
nr:MAG TPA: hypothetical protein [Bacteriophage sp.]